MLAKPTPGVRTVDPAQLGDTNQERRVKARIDPGAMNNVTRFFNASTDAIIREMLQNARRACAYTVRITTGKNRITIEDDGIGIADPQELLDFGGSGWMNEQTRAEDPAGMGFFSLARRNATVESWTGSGPGWRMALEPEHFTGETEATIAEVPNARGRTGTRVTFENTVEQQAAL